MGRTYIGSKNSNKGPSKVQEAQKEHSDQSVKESEIQKNGHADDQTFSIEDLNVTDDEQETLVSDTQNKAQEDLHEPTTISSDKCENVDSEKVKSESEEKVSGNINGMEENNTEQDGNYLNQFLNLLLTSICPHFYLCFCLLSTHFLYTITQ